MSLLPPSEIRQPIKDLLSFHMDRDTPVFWGDPKKLTFEQLEACRFKNRSHHFAHDLSVAGVRYFHEMQAQLRGDAEDDSELRYWERMRHPFVFRYPDDIPDEKTLLSLSRRLFSAIDTMNAHMSGGVGMWTYYKFLPKSNRARVILRDDAKPVISGEDILHHEVEHAKVSASANPGVPNYICIGLRVAPASYPPKIELYSAYQKKDGARVIIDEPLHPKFPSIGDLKIAVRLGYQESMQVLQQKPWWNVLQDSLQSNAINRPSSVDTTLIRLAHVWDELFLPTNNKTPDIAIDRSKIARIEYVDA